MSAGHRGVRFGTTRPMEDDATAKKLAAPQEGAAKVVWGPNSLAPLNGFAAPASHHRRERQQSRAQEGHGCRLGNLRRKVDG